jgi:tetratricopeptide (TPR) repeat protein
VLSAAGFALLVAVAPTFAAPESDLVASAAVSGRPPECMPPARAAAGRDAGDPASIWRLARHPNLRRYCQLVARAHARLATDLEGARSAAAQAERLLPGRPAPSVVLARAALAAGKVDDALKSFDKALSIDPRAADHPLALLDLARARRRAGRLDDALSSYRVLVPRASLLPSRELRALVLLEAAHATMAVAEKAKDSAQHLDEALAYLREAARDPHHRVKLDIALSLVLALDRAGRRTQADAVLAEQRGTAAWTERNDAGYVANVNDIEALAALALERQDPAKAAERWRSYLTKAEGSYRDAASARLERLAARPTKNAAKKNPGRKRKNR